MIIYKGTAAQNWDAGTGVPDEEIQRIVQCVVVGQFLQGLHQVLFGLLDRFFNFYSVVFLSLYFLLKLLLSLTAKSAFA